MIEVFDLIEIEIERMKIEKEENLKKNAMFKAFLEECNEQEILNRLNTAYDWLGVCQVLSGEGGEVYRPIENLPPFHPIKLQEEKWEDTTQEI